MRLNVLSKFNHIYNIFCQLLQKKEVENKGQDLMRLINQTLGGYKKDFPKKCLRGFLGVRKWGLSGFGLILPYKSIQIPYIIYGICAPSVSENAYYFKEK